MNYIPLINSKAEVPNPELEFKNGYKVGSIRLGTRALYFRSGFKIYYIPYSDVYRYFRRIKLVPAKMCCSRFNLEIEYLVLCDKKRELAEIQIPSKREALDLMERLKVLIPNAKVGSNKKRKNNFEG